MPRSAWLAVGVALGAAAGAIAGKGFGLAASASLTVVALVAAAIVIGQRWGGPRDRGPRGRRSRNVWSTRLVAVGVGLTAISLRLAVGASVASPSPTSLPEGSGPWTAVVISLGAPKSGAQLTTLRLGVGAGLTVAATLPRYPEIEPGDQIRVAGELRLPPDDDYGRFLDRTGVVATLNSRRLERLGQLAGPTWLLERLRRGSADALARALPEPEAGLAAGILIGLRDRIDRDLAAAFTTAGVSHIVAISGWNISIVAASIAALAGRFNRRRRAVLTVLAIVAYVAFAGASLSVLRAAVMTGVVLLARETGRAGRAAGALGWAAAVLLLADPANVTDAGFQLSTLATAGLLAWGTSLAKRLAGPEPGRLRAWLAESLGVSLAAQAATLPLIVIAFGRLSLVAPAVNLAVTPIVAPAMAAGALALLAGWLVAAGGPSAIATVAGLPAWGCLGLLVAGVRIGAGLPFASVTIGAPASFIAAGFFTAISLVVVQRHRLRDLWRGVGPWPAAGPWHGAGHDHTTSTADPSSRGSAARKRRTDPPTTSRGAALTAAALAVAVASLGLAWIHRPDGSTRITVLDVGQGDSILIQGSRGARLLIDGGPDPNRLLMELDEQLPPWDRRLDAIILTHPHEDHVAGLAMLLGRYRVGRVYEPGMLGPGPGYQAWSEALGRGGPSHGTLAAGDNPAVDNPQLRVLWPDPGAVPLRPPDTGTGINNVSVVLLGDVDGRRVLLAGDIEEAIDPQLLARGLPQVDFLKVAHHGSRTSSTDAFLNAVRPGVAVISAGTGNPYGHPAPATIARLVAHGARVFRTDLDGSVQVMIGAGRLTVHAAGGRAKAAALPGGAAIAARLVSTVFSRAAGSGFACGIAASRPQARADSTPPPLAGVPPSGLLYHRGDDGPRASGRRLAAPFPSPQPAIAASFASGRRSGRLAGRSNPGQWDRHRPPPLGGGRLAPRRRQGAPGIGSPPRAPPR